MKRKFLVKDLSEDRPASLARAITEWLTENVKSDEEFTVAYAQSGPEYSAIIVVRL